MHYPVAPSVRARGLPWVVRGVVQSLRAYLWSLRWSRQLVEGTLVSWNVLGSGPGWALLSVQITWYPLNQNSSSFHRSWVWIEMRLWWTMVLGVWKAHSASWTQMFYLEVGVSLSEKIRILSSSNSELFEFYTGRFFLENAEVTSDVLWSQTNAFHTWKLILFFLIFSIQWKCKH